MRRYTLKKRGSFRSGFTLIELLVVIAIVAMLMSIMMPGLKDAKEVSKQLACLSNIRQLTIGWTSYNSDNEERLCAPHTQYGEDTDLPVESRRWVMEDYPPYKIEGVDAAIGSGVLYPYVSAPGPYKCEADRLDRSRSFALAHGMGAVMIRDELKPVTRFTKIRNTSSKIVFADAEAGVEDFIVSKSFCPVSVKDSRWMKMSHKCFISVRHREGSNFTFADGHAEQWKWKDPRTVNFALTGGTNVAEAAAVSLGNEDLERIFLALRLD